MNTDRSKQLLQQALNSLPHDFALSETRQAINVAIQKLERVEAKRTRRKAETTAQEAWQAAIQDGINKLANKYPKPASVSENSAKNIIALIDRMIKDEKNKMTESERLSSLKNRNNKDKNGDVQNFFG